jgi:hypothetical protein
MRLTGHAPYEGLTQSSGRARRAGVSRGWPTALGLVGGLDALESEGVSLKKPVVASERVVWGTESHARL